MSYQLKIEGIDELFDAKSSVFIDKKFYYDLI